jgi:hypothetical protein
MRQVFQVINSMVDDDVLEAYAIGGAIAATFYLEPVLTEDVDVFVHIAVEMPLFRELSPVYEYLGNKGYRPKREHVEIEGWDVQFLLYDQDEITREAVENPNIFDFEGVDVRVMIPEYLVAIMLKTGRAKDYARATAFLEQAKVDVDALSVLISRFGLEEQWQKLRSL